MEPSTLIPGNCSGRRTGCLAWRPGMAQQRPRKQITRIDMARVLSICRPQAKQRSRELTPYGFRRNKRTAHQMQPKLIEKPRGNPIAQPIVPSQEANRLPIRYPTAQWMPNSTSTRMFMSSLPQRPEAQAVTIACARRKRYRRWKMKPSTCCWK